MRNNLNLLFLLVLCLFSKAQVVTVTLVASEDAAIGFHDGLNTANMNYGNAIQNAAFWIPATAAVGINANRSLIKFNLSAIPSGVFILSASLNLYGMGPYGTLNGHSGINNSCIIERITQNWNESIVTWNTQPNSTSLNSTTIASSNSNSQDYLNIPVTGIVTDMYNNNAHYGIKLKLLNETLTNSMIFCSLNYTNTTKHPKLIVTYSTCSPVNVTQNKTNICTGDSVLLIAQNANSYQWSNGLTTSSIVVKPLSTSIYSVTGTFSNCASTATVTVNVNQPPIILISTANFSICQGQNLVLSASGASSYTWANGSNSSQLYISPVATSQYSIIGQSNGCVSSASTTIYVKPSPILSVTGNTIICLGQSTTLTASGTINYIWSNGINGNNNVISPQTTSFYTLTGTSVNGCSSSIITTVNVSKCEGIMEISLKSPLWFPNPSNGIFERFLSENTEIIVTDIYGKIVYQSKTSSTGYHKIDLTDISLKSGIYLITTQSDSTRTSQKIILTD